MKTINNWITIICVIASFGFTLVSCTDEGENTRKNDSRTVQLTLSAPANEVVSPMTKGVATSIDETINNICVLIYDKIGNIIADESFYRSTDDNAEGLSDIQNNTAGHTYYLNLADDNTRTIYVVANVGDKISSWTTTSDIEGVYDLEKVDGQMLPQCILFADKQTFSSATQVVTAELKRIYAKITVVVDASGVKDATITPSSVALKNIPITGSLATNKIKESPSEGEYLPDGGSINLVEVNDKIWGRHTEGTTAFFMYENMQPEGYCYDNDQTSKTPKSIGQVSKDPSTVKNDKTCSYIELSTDYVGEKGRGTVAYRFFLGKTVFKNFEVERNTHYKVTLKLTGNGGIDEASWRVEADIQGKFTPHDAYVGYLVNSKSRIYIDGGDNLQSGNWTINRRSGDAIVSDGSITLKKDNESGKYYFEVTAKQTNVSDRESKQGIYTISSSITGVESKDVTITQVIRILDPIAYYHQNTGTSFNKDVIVKVFEKSPANFYVPLSSVGAWTVTREYGDWFTLDKHSDDNSNSTVKSSNNVITGEGGAVKFHFRAGSLGYMPTRYGCISVKYHNNMCEHKIYLRQGGGDTQLIDGAAEWAYSNVMSNGENGTYATQPGPMFAGGSSKGISSITPGYRAQNSIEGGDRSNWGTNSETRQGPCPKGYVMPSIRDMSVLKKACYGDNGLIAAVGYIYDDDPLSGWSWQDYKAVVTDQSHSNPAKGIVLVNTKNNKNLVFPFGNGVLVHNKVPDANKNDMDTGLDEIGVGFRPSGMLYTEEDLENAKNPYASYNGNYWSGTPSQDSGLGNHLCYMKFWYFLKRNVPIYVSDGSDRWGKDWVVKKNDAIGADRGNGMFIRCVKVGSSQKTDNSYWNNTNW
ncbi:DUF4906 domain-containing protein [Parabacteroides sp.]|uniref:fimbrial protein n=1 Tax=Parabacteroides sp. TaxID=1869337 RepID=UPI00307FD826